MRTYETTAENVEAGDRIIIAGRACEVLTVAPDGDPVDPTHYLITFVMLGGEVRTYRRLSSEFVDVQHDARGRDRAWSVCRALGDDHGDNLRYEHTGGGCMVTTLLGKTFVTSVGMDDYSVQVCTRAAWHQMENNGDGLDDDEQFVLDCSTAADAAKLMSRITRGR